MSTARYIAAAHPDSVHRDGTTTGGNAGQVRLAGDPSRPGPSVNQSGDHHGPESHMNVDRSAMVPQDRRAIRSWPLLVLAAPAAAAVWSGWVGIGQMTGFGEIRPLPGIWESLHIDTAVTLPIGVEAYAAFALRAWLTSKPAVSDRTRRFARWSAIGALVLGMAGQVAYHLLRQADMTRAPWEVTTLVSCLPVLVLGLGSALAHLLRSDASVTDAQAQIAAMETGDQKLTGQCLPECSGQDQHGSGAHMTFTWPDSNPETTLVQHQASAGTTRAPSWPPERRDSARPPARMRPSEAYTAAARVVASGQQISRRSLRSAGLHGSNADLGMLSRLVRAKPPSDGPLESP